MVIPHEMQRVASWQERAGNGFPVLADGGFLASSIYGIAFQMRIHTDTSNTPGVFLIGKDGVIRFLRIGTGPRNFADRPTIDEVLAEIDSW